MGETENTGNQHFLPFLLFKVALQILGQKFYKNTKKLPVYSQSLLIFIHNIPVVESHLTTTTKITTAQVDTDRNYGLFLHEQLAHLQTGNTQKVSNIASDEDIRENTYLFVMLRNLSVISHFIFRQCYFFLVQNLKIT